MDPDDIKLANLNKSFEYAKFCNEIDSIDDFDTMKTVAKCYFKLYLKQQEVIADLVVPQL